MLQFPTNVYPQNTAIDVSDNVVTRSFTFNGDKLTWVYSQIYDNETGEKMVTGYAPQNGTGKPYWYNGDTVTLSSSAYQKLENGKDYAHQMVLTQNDANGNPIYDIYIGRGRTYGNSTSNALFVDSSLNNIYEYGRNYYTGGGLTFWGDREPLYIEGKLAAGIMIEINGKRYFVNSYHSFLESTSRGILYTDATDELSLPEGTEYKLYSNYLVTPFYFFKCRTAPTVEVTVEGKQNGIYCSAVYSQAENVSLKYYKFYLYEIVDDAEILIDESPKIYSYKLNYTFCENYSGKIYKVVCEVATQDNVVTKADKSISFDEATYEYLSAIDKPYFVPLTNAVHVGWTKNETCSVRLYREDMSTGEIILVADTYKNYYNDYTASNNKSYHYIAVPYYNNIVGKSMTSETIDIKYMGWTITDATIGENDWDNRPVYLLGDTWKFIGEIDNVIVTQNTDKTLHVGFSEFPVMSESDTNYMSGTLSATIGYLECSKEEWIDNIDLVNAWRKFITQHRQFILKSQKGDVWFVNITENPSTEYDESYANVLTRTSFSWAEADKPKNILFIER